jgi:hypothetical protein
VTVEIIPAIDLKGGRCVRLRQGRMEDETVFSDNPAAVARRWEDAGAPRIHLVDLDGAVGGTPVNARAVEAIVGAVGVPTQRDRDPLVMPGQRDHVGDDLGAALRGTGDAEEPPAHGSDDRDVGIGHDHAELSRSRVVPRDRYRHRQTRSGGPDPGGHVELCDGATAGQIARCRVAVDDPSDDGDVGERSTLVAVVHVVLPRDDDCGGRSRSSLTVERPCHRVAFRTRTDGDAVATFQP